MEEDEIYYVDTRNATPVVISRSGPNGQGGNVLRPGGGRVIRPMPGGAINRYGSSYGSPYMVGSSAASQYGMPIGAGLGGMFAGVTPGALVDLVAQVFAAVMPLPSAPTGTSDPGTDVPNLITYQSALAQYAKRDEQIRTLGNLVTKLLG
jgi:hypothetical protein